MKFDKVSGQVAINQQSKPPIAQSIALSTEVKLPLTFTDKQTPWAMLHT